MDSPTSKRHYAFEIAHSPGEEALARIRQYLLWTFPDQPPENIDQALARSPVRFTSITTRENAEHIIRKITQMGAEVTLTDLSAGGDEAPAIAEGASDPASRPTRPPPEAAETAETDSGGDAETTMTDQRAPLARHRLAGADEGIREAEQLAADRVESESRPPTFFWSAWAEAVFSPVAFFARLRAPGGIMQALLFAATLGLLAMILSFPASSLALLDQGALEMNDLGERYVTALFMQPFASVIATCFTAWLLHIGLRIVAGPRPFHVTLKVVSYTTAGAVFAAIPKAGPSIAGFVTFLLILVGLSSAQRISPIRALGAVVLPLFFMGFVVILAVGSFALGSYFILEALRS